MQETYDEFLTGFGLVPTSFDPRCFCLSDDDGDLITLIHVDNSRMTFTGIIIVRFCNAWADRFDEKLTPPGALKTGFTGLQFTFAGEGEDRYCEITCSGVI